MKKFYVLVLSAMFAMGPIAVVADEPQYDCSEGEVEAACIDSAEMNEVMKIVDDYDAKVDSEKESEESVEPTETIDTTGMVESVDTVGSLMIDERFGVGDKIEMNKTFNNSLFLAGNYIADESSAVNGIGFFAGRQLNLSGNYEYGVHAGGELLIKSKYERDLFAVGDKIILANEASVARDAFMAGNEITILTNIHGDAVLAGNKIIFGDVTIDGDLKVAVNEIEFRGNTVVKGEFLHNDTAEVRGKIEAAKTSTYHVPFVDIKINEMMIVCFQLAAAIVIFIVFRFIARNFFNGICESAKTDNGNEITVTFFGGAIAAIVAPVLAAILMVTIVGIPAGFILLFIWGLLLALSSSACASFIAAKVMPNMNNIVSTILVLILFTILSMIPYLSIVCTIAEICFGLGLIARALFVEKK